MWSEGNKHRASGRSCFERKPDHAGSGREDGKAWWSVSRQGPKSTGQALGSERDPVKVDAPKVLSTGRIVSQAEKWVNIAEIRVCGLKQQLR